MEKEQVQAIIIEMVKEVSMTNKQTKRGIVTDMDAHNRLTGMMQGVKLAIKALEPNMVLMDIKTIRDIIDNLYLGTNEQKAQAENNLNLLVTMIAE